MMTHEINAIKKCCLYASDFHLEMILLPYIRERLGKSEFIVLTQNDLSSTIRLLLDRVNLKEQEKKSILEFNWKPNLNINIEEINDKIKKNHKIEFIVNGDFDYVKKINNDLKLLGNSNFKIIDCLNINDKNLNLNKIKDEYKEFINTSKI